MYACLKGIESKQAKIDVERLIGRLHLTDCADAMSKSYSGGNKRKLSVAIALLGYVIQLKQSLYSLFIILFGHYHWSQEYEA